MGRRERNAYIDAVVTEMTGRLNETAGPLSTVYLGGGTPSVLSDDNLEHLFSALHKYHTLVDDAEVTVECNPDDLVSRPHLASLLAHLGVNRVSMGVQSFNNATLRDINRRHSPADAHAAIKALHAAGIHNISIDLIYGLPEQDMETWQRDVNVAAALASDMEVTHISSYALTVEEGTQLYNMRAEGKFTEVDEQQSMDMYNLLVDTLTATGLEHYEISNFCVPGYASRHNSNYWRGVPYVGLGPGAHSYDGRDTRRWNHCDLTAYTTAPLTTFEEEHLTPSELYDELIMTRLRTRAGLPLTLLTDVQRHYLLRMAHPYIESGKMAISGNTLALTRQGIFVSDAIFADLMWDPDLSL